MLLGVAVTDVIAVALLTVTVALPCVLPAALAVQLASDRVAIV